MTVNPTLVVLGIILIVAIFLLYKVLVERGKLIATKIDLSQANNTTSINSLSNPTSSRYNLSLWIYADSLKQQGETEIMKIAKGSGETMLSVTLNQSTHMKYKISTPNGIVTNIITENFPLQKWTCVVISVDNNVVDLYLDGKLFRSQQLKTQPSAITEDCVISYGNCANYCKVYVAMFERQPYPMDPTTAWNNYLKGNGGNRLDNLFSGISNYGAKMQITQDDLKLTEFNLF